MEHDQWVLYSGATLVLCVLWYIWRLVFPKKYISRDEKLSAMNAFCEKTLPSVDGVQPGGILIQSLTRYKHSALTFDYHKKELIFHDVTKFREHEKLNGYTTFLDGDTLWIYLDKNQLENLYMTR